MAHPYKSQSKTGQARADARYTPVKNKAPEGPLMAEARKNTRESDGPEELFAESPSRQISNYGKVRK